MGWGGGDSTNFQEHFIFIHRIKKAVEAIHLFLRHGHSTYFIVMIIKSHRQLFDHVGIYLLKSLFGHCPVYVTQEEEITELLRLMLSDMQFCQMIEHL